MKLAHLAMTKNKTKTKTPRRTTKALVIAGLVFNLFWLVAVLGQNDWLWLLCLTLLCYWGWYPQSLPFVLPLALLGCAMDSGLLWLGVYQFDGGLIPVWLGVLWLGFTSFLWFIRHNLRRFSTLILLIAGSLGGAGSYLAGVQLGVIAWPLGTKITFLMVSSCWLAFTVLILMWMRCLR
ncbi:DUF2878 family protein [Photobacterium galatheae]|uniref:DUF2878 family protein n=1 Tax=Photobacterium galatheae TaxID=1654360 RepID=UPI00202CB60B|nr:DUF2878 family protein [Photobacterium galatheae]MCM0148952.1 DUF2878 family protein [Photobacterium galatheae]